MRADAKDLLPVSGRTSSVYAWAEASLRRVCSAVGLPPPRFGGGGHPVCPHLDLARCGITALTGHPGQRPATVGAPLMAHARALESLLAALGARSSGGLSVGDLLVERAAVRGMTAAGRISANGSCRLLPSGTGWIAVNLARDTDWELVPALTGVASAGDWSAVEDSAAGQPGAAFVEQAQTLGIPAAELAAPLAVPLGTPFSVTRLGRPSTAVHGMPLVVDFSSLWAGPLAAHLLSRAGLTVAKVEDPNRPDGARAGDPRLFARLHAESTLHAVDLRSEAGLREVRALLERADVVIEASRPRALAQLGIDATRFVAERPGRTWVSITGHGRGGPRSNWVGFGDDAAVSGGLVGRDAAGGPVFCGDALADPLTGLCAAAAALLSRAHGGGHLIDVPMHAVSRYVASGPPCPARHHAHALGSGEWRLSHDSVEGPVIHPRPASAGAP